VRAASGPSERAVPPIAPREIARMLADRVDQLVLDLLPAGHREGHEWRVGSVAGEAGHSLGVHLAGNKAGVWCDFSGSGDSGDSGDALDLVCSVFGVDMGRALAWSRRWLGLDDDEAEPPSQRAAAPSIETEPQPDPGRWRYPWQRAQPIARTLAEAYLARRGLCFDDPKSRVLRFAARRARQSPTGELEYHPALLAALSDFRFARCVVRLNGLGPRALYEVLTKIGARFLTRTPVEQIVGEYTGRLDREILVALGGYRMPPVPIHQTRNDDDNHGEFG
jgi:hypothetical protein